MSVMGTPSTLRPAWLPTKGTIARLRNRRTAMRIARQIFDGDWKSVLLDMKRSEHQFGSVMQHTGRLGVLIKKINIVKVAMLTHADVLAGREPIIDLPEEFTGQWEAIEQISRRSLFAARFHEASLKVAIEGHAALRVDYASSGPNDRGAAIFVERNAECFPMDHAGPDGQPTVWERRWIIEREEMVAGRKQTVRYIRVERHRVDPALGGLIEQEAYQATGSDVLVDLAELPRVTLERAIGPTSAIPEERRVTGLDWPSVTELVGYRIDGEPFPLIDERDLSLIDQCAKAFSDLARTHARHATPKVRVPEEMIDRKTGNVDLTLEAIVDNEKKFEYIKVESQLDQMLTFMERCVQWLMVQIQMAQALIGFKVGGGAAAETYEKLVLDATPTLSRANRAALYADGALSRVFTMACQLDSALPMRGFDVHPVSVETRPTLPKDKSQRVIEQSAALAAGLTSEIDAIEEVHGPRRAQAIYERIQADRKAKSERDAAAFAGALPPLTIPNEPAPEVGGGDPPSQTGDAA